MRFRALAIVLAAVAIAASSYALRGPSAVEPPPPPSRDSSAVETLQTSVNTDEVARLIKVFEQRVKQNSDALDLRFLGGLYLQRARAFGDVADYGRAGAALERSLQLRPADLETRSALATLRYTTHDFGGALTAAREILASDPSAISAVAIVGDAQMELGDYAGAASSYGLLAAKFPNVAAVDARLARLAFLRGDAGAAREHSVRASTEAGKEGAFGPGLAWYQHLEAQVALDRGDYDAAAAHEQQALDAAPNYDRCYSVGLATTTNRGLSVHEPVEV